MDLFKYTIRTLFLFILTFSLGNDRTKAQSLSLSISTTLTSPATNTPQIAGATLTYHTVVSYNGPGSVSATVALNFSGMTLLGVITPNTTAPNIPTYVVDVGTPTSNVYTVTGISQNFSISFDYTCIINTSNSSAINTTTVSFTPTISGISPTNSVVQTFIKPILVQPTDVTICSGSPVNEALTADNSYTSYIWAATPNASTVNVQGPIGNNTIQDIVTNTGSTIGTVIYTVTPQIKCTTILPDGTQSTAINTTSGDVGTFSVTVRVPPQVLSVSITGNGTIYVGESALFIPNSDFTSGTYTWYDSMDKTNFIANGVLTEPKLSEGTHTFYVTVTDPNSCEGIPLAATINVLPLPITPPKELTPNNDGIEDTWVIPGIEKYPTCKVEIFDMWGSRVYSSTPGYTIPWNGTFHDVALSVATYYYIINLNNGSRPISGYVAIIR